jgi:hypothetical protein
MVGLLVKRLTEVQVGETVLRRANVIWTQGSRRKQGSELTIRPYLAAQFAVNSARAWRTSSASFDPGSI